MLREEANRKDILKDSEKRQRNCLKQERGETVEEARIVTDSETL